MFYRLFAQYPLPATIPWGPWTLAWAICCVSCFNANAGDWPQILGPHRSGVVDEKLPDHFPQGGPQQVWSVPLGQGYAGPIVQGDKVIAFHRLEDVERLECFSVSTGRSLWKADFPATYRGGVDADVGPRCVPIISQGGVFVYGAGGDCHCVELATGKPVWSRELAVDYAAPDGYFGAGSTPIVIGERLLVNVGGKQGGIVALNLASGKTEFAVSKEQASYASPALYRQGPREFAIFVTRFNVVKLDPRTGDFLTLFPFGKLGPTVNAAVPLVLGDQLFTTSSYGVGATLASLSPPEAKVIWSNDETLSSQYATPVIRGDYLYGIHGREDIPPAHLRCVAWKTGKILWTREAFGVAHAILAGHKLLLLTVEGELVLTAASPEKYIELSRAKVTKGVTRALPALSNGKIYFRTNAGGAGELVCLQLAD